MAFPAVKKAKREALELQLQVLVKMSDLATAAFGFVAALAWNTAIQAVFKIWFADIGTAWQPLVGYALLVTLIAVLVIVWMGRIVGRVKPLVERAAKAEGTPTAPEA